MFVNSVKRIIIHNELVNYRSQGVERMRASGKLASEVLAMAGAMIAPGVTTEAIDKAVHDMVIARGAYPSPLRYGAPPFPKSVCTSVNEVVCHGIPDMRPLKSGNILVTLAATFRSKAAHHTFVCRIV